MERGKPLADSRIGPLPRLPCLQCIYLRPPTYISPPYNSPCTPLTILRTQSWQLWVATGIFLGFTASLIVFRAGDWAWRLMVGSACIPAIPLLILVYISPESPRWYMKRGSPSDYDKALRAMIRLRNTPLQAHRDFYLMHKQLQYERTYFRPVGGPDLEHAALRPAMHRLGTYCVRVSERFFIPRIRRASLAAGTVMLAQQLCGINVLAFYRCVGWKAPRGLLDASR